MPRRSPKSQHGRVAIGTARAQLSLIEHALCPLDPSASLRNAGLHVVQYDFTAAHRKRKTATASVASPFGLSANDELYLYGLLALTFAQKEPTIDFYATPHYFLRRLGLVDPKSEQGKRYEVFRSAIRRLAGVVYQNDRFYDPIRGEHRDVAFGFLKYSLPHDPGSSRAWHFIWDPQFFRFCQALGGSLQFDFEQEASRGNEVDERVSHGHEQLRDSRISTEECQNHWETDLDFMVPPNSYGSQSLSELGRPRHF